KPTPAMREAIARAEVGDDVYGEDPTVNRLEAIAAERLGKEAAVLVSSGTMGNQAALRALTRHGDVVLAGEGAHVLRAEAGAAVASGVDVSRWAASFDTVSFCLSKGLGAPAGSVVCGDRDVIVRVRRARKMLGGAMRQAGILAAAGVYALEHNVDRLADDHAN